MSRIFILILGLIGGLLGVFSAIFSLYLRDFKNQVQTIDIVEPIILYSTLAVIGSFIFLVKPKIGGLFLFFSALAFVFTIKYTGIMGILAATTLFTSALMTFKDKYPTKKKRKATDKRAEKKKIIRTTSNRHIKKKAV